MNKFVYTAWIFYSFLILYCSPHNFYIYASDSTGASVSASATSASSTSASSTLTSIMTNIELELLFDAIYKGELKRVKRIIGDNKFGNINKLFYNAFLGGEDQR